MQPRFPLGFRHVLNGYLRFFSHDGDCRFYSPKRLTALVASSEFEPVGIPHKPNSSSYMIVFSKRVYGR